MRRWWAVAALVAAASGAAVYAARFGERETRAAGPRVAREARAAPTVVGSVLDEEGRAVEGARVRLRDGARTIARSTSDADGSFRLEPPPATTSERHFHAWVEPPAGWFAARTHERVEAGSERRVDFVLSTRARIAGRVERTGGDVAAGMRVELVAPDGTVEEVRTDGGGRFTGVRGGAAGRWTVRLPDVGEAHDVELVALADRLVPASGGPLVVASAGVRELPVRVTGGPIGDAEWTAELHALRGGGWATPVARGTLVRGEPDRVVFPPFETDPDDGHVLTLASVDGAWYASAHVEPRALDGGTTLPLLVHGRGRIDATVHGMPEGRGGVLRAVPLDDAAREWLRDPASEPPHHGVEGWIDGSARRDLGPIAEGEWLVWVEVDGERALPRRVEVRGGEAAAVVLDAPRR